MWEKVQGSRFRVLGSGFQGSGVQGSGVQGFRVQGSGVQGFRGSGFWVQGFRVQGSGVHRCLRPEGWLSSYMKHIVGTVNRLNVEHPTSNVQY
jgi:hypothetical protein